jgi:hypothetical protein
MLLLLGHWLSHEGLACVSCELFAPLELMYAFSISMDFIMNLQKDMTPSLQSWITIVEWCRTAADVVIITTPYYFQPSLVALDVFI